MNVKIADAHSQNRAASKKLSNTLSEQLHLMSEYVQSVRRMKSKNVQNAEIEIAKILNRKWTTYVMNAN